MNIRNATYRDAPAIKLLLEALGYKTSTILLVSQLEKLFGQNDHQVLVYELNKDVLGFISIHYLPQLGFDAELVIITYLSVDETVSDQSIGAALEEYVAAQAIKRKCDRIQVHCSEWRAPTHKFYKQQGYQEYPQYYTKRLIYAE
ncbi:GNAT family N-acetyltransferase [Mucilaginibacter sp.]|jgi:N-acetylglutamate synthase-like GNAT family acetyltransferase|uniref:GNAT family N-acetyltransferase n=1 Tax=Mucilaginibacter sp. TaxID=1882438 RepID=UPI0035648F5E